MTNSRASSKRRTRASGSVRQGLERHAERDLSDDRCRHGDGQGVAGGSRRRRRGLGGDRTGYRRQLPVGRIGYLSSLLPEADPDAVAWTSLVRGRSGIGAVTRGVVSARREAADLREAKDRQGTLFETDWPGGVSETQLNLHRPAHHVMGRSPREHAGHPGGGLKLRDEIAHSSGSIDDVQMSLFQAVYGTVTDRPAYADATYYGEITHPSPLFTDLMAKVAVRLGGARTTPGAGTVAAWTRRWAAASRTA